MPGLASLFSGVNFQGTIKKYCDQNRWKIAEIDAQHATLIFGMESGRTQILYIIRYETTLEFSVPSIAKFDSEDGVPHYLSTVMLKRNAQNKVGFWCIEQIGGKHVFSYMHNAELKLIDSEYFKRIVLALIKECDDFEGILAQMLR